MTITGAASIRRRDPSRSHSFIDRRDIVAAKSPCPVLALDARACAPDSAGMKDGYGSGAVQPALQLAVQS
jgi:hypothetical protein